MNSRTVTLTKEKIKPQKSDSQNTVGCRENLMDLFFCSIRDVVEEIRVMDPAYYMEHIPALIKERYSDQSVFYRTPADKIEHKMTKILVDGCDLYLMLEKYKSRRLENLKQHDVMLQIFKDNIMM